MDTEKINHWLSLLANFGVVAGIIFLAVEIRQNQESLEEANVLNRLSASSAAFDYNVTHRAFLLENENLMQVWIKGRKGEPLDEIEQNQFNYICANLYWANSTVYERYLILGNEAGAYGTANTTARGIQDYPGLEKCFMDLAGDMSDFGFEAFVQESLDLAGRSRNLR